jgi:hypothetical protein
MANIGQEFDVRLDFINEVCGSTPGNPDLIEPWLKSRAPKVTPPGGRTIDEINEEVFATLPEQEEVKRKRQAGCMAHGDYERPDEEMLALWRTGVQETAKHYCE